MNYLITTTTTIILVYLLQYCPMLPNSYLSTIILDYAPEFIPTILDYAL